MSLSCRIYVLPISKYTTILSCHAVMFYVFLNIRQTKVCITRLASSAQRVLAFMPAVQAFMQAINVFMQAFNAFMQYVNAFMQAASSLRPPAVVCTDANRRETMPKQHYITCLAQCVPTLHPPSGFVSTPPSFYCRTLVGSLPLANNGQHSASTHLVHTIHILLPLPHFLLLPHNSKPQRERERAPILVEVVHIYSDSDITE